MYEELFAHGYELIPIHKTDKKPLHVGWQTELPVKQGTEGLYPRLGVRLRASDLVIDVDPRNGGRLESVPNWRIYPCVETGGGGWHLYGLLPAGVGKLKHTLKKLPGVEFKTFGRFVVAPGSPGYSWALWSVDIGSRPVVPDSTIKMITRSSPSELPAGTGCWSPEQLAEVLRQLNVLDFREHDDWFKLMTACHEATSGMGGDVFTAWCIGDPRYHAHANKIMSRWNSFESGREGNAGLGTLLWILDKHGVVLPAGEDFADAPIVGLESTIETDPTMALLNREYLCVDEDGKLRVFTRREDSTVGRSYWVRYTRRDFLEVVKSVRQLKSVPCGTTAAGAPKMEDAGEHWLDHHRDKRTYMGITFAPEHQEDKTPDGKLNLWQGFAPVTRDNGGSWDVLKELLLWNLCAGEVGSYEYVLSWMARAVQRPWEPGGTALVFKGPKGTGKGTLGRAFVQLFGQHGMQVMNQTLLTGRFNMHLRDVCALFADEAFWAGDKAGEGVLKGLITEPVIVYEGKGTNAEMGRNCVHVIMASNEQWVVPAGMDGERRFAVFNVESETHNATYWEKVRACSLGAMLEELLARDLSGFDVFKVPQTEALSEQKMRTMDPIAAWLHEAACDEWNNIGITTNGLYAVEDVQAAYLRYCDRANVRGQRLNITSLGIAVRRYIGSDLHKRRVQIDGRQRYFYALPAAQDVVDRIETLLGMKETG